MVNKPWRDRYAKLMLHRRSHLGKPILQHRSIAGLHLPMGRLAVGVLIALGFTALLLWAKPGIASLWAEQLVWWMKALELPGQFAVQTPGNADLLLLPVPMIDVQLRDMGALSPAAHALAVVAIWILSGWLPDSAKPGAYLIRFAAIIHGGSILYFLLWPASFPHSLIGHAAGGLREAWALMLLTPWIHLFTFYLFPFLVWHRLALTAVTLLFLFVLVPLQYATHAALLHLMGMIVMPLLHLLFGVMVPILGIVALYGWGMSWHDPTRSEP